MGGVACEADDSSSNARLGSALSSRLAGIIAHAGLEATLNMRAARSTRKEENRDVGTLAPLLHYRSVSIRGP